MLEEQCRGLGFYEAGCPEEERFGEIKGSGLEGKKVVLGFHGRSGVGLDLVNSPPAVQGGTGQVGWILKRIETRAGNTRLEEIVVAASLLWPELREEAEGPLHRAGVRGYVEKSLWDVVKLVENMFGVMIAEKNSIVGATLRRRGFQQLKA